jgi:hypothetical protein
MFIASSRERGVYDVEDKSTTRQHVEGSSSGERRGERI